MKSLIVFGVVAAMFVGLGTTTMPQGVNADNTAISPQASELNKFIASAVLDHGSWTIEDHVLWRDAYGPFNIHLRSRIYETKWSLIDS